MKAFKSLLLGALVLAGAMLVLGLATPAAAQTPVPAYTTVVADAWSYWYWDCGYSDYHWGYDWGWGPSWYHGFDWYSGWDWTWTPTPWWYDYLYSYYCHWVWVEIYGTSLVQVPGTNATCTYHITVNFSDGSAQHFTQPGNGGAINLHFTHSATDPVPTGASATETCCDLAIFVQSGASESNCAGCPVTFEIFNPAGGTIEWSGGGSPATGTGNTFTTTWNEAGTMLIKARRAGTSCEATRSMIINKNFESSNVIWGQARMALS